MPTSDLHPRNRVADTIRRMASSPVTRRYAAALPQFEVSHDLPAEMDTLLKRLEKQEKTRR